MDALGHLGCMCGALGDKTKMLFYNGNRPSDTRSPYGLKKLGIENAPPFLTRGVLFDVQGLKGRVLDIGEEIALPDLKACLKRQGVPEETITPGDAVFVRSGHGSRWYTETKTFYDGARLIRQLTSISVEPRLVPIGPDFPPFVRSEQSGF